MAFGIVTYDLLIWTKLPEKAPYQSVLPEIKRPDGAWAGKPGKQRRRGQGKTVNESSVIMSVSLVKRLPPSRKALEDKRRVLDQRTLLVTSCLV